MWISVQALIPLARKFDFAPFRFVSRTFSWSMFTRPSLRYEVEVYRRGPAGEKDPIPRLESFVPGLRSPGPTPWVEPNYGVARIQARLVRLLSHIARQRGDEDTYVVVMGWRDDSGRLRRWTHSLPASGGPRGGE